jgi:beta-glucuronidase
MKPINNTLLFLLAFCPLTIFPSLNYVHAQSAMANVFGRNTVSLDGDWQVIIDPTGAGDWRQVWKEQKPQKKSDFIEYAFEGGPTLHVPGDFNTQIPELAYTEGTVWYKKPFTYTRKNNKRLFLHFSAVNYMATVYLNGNYLGSHEGGFTPFQFEITAPVLEGNNSIVVKVNNQRRADGLPALGYDWFNYGGITREVHLVETNNTFIEDYFIQLKKHSSQQILGWIKLTGDKLSQTVHIRIPELKMDYHTTTDNSGNAAINFSSKFQLWSPENPKLYKVIIESESDSIIDNIGFRNIEVSGTKITLNGKAIFLKGINIHEERPMNASKAYSETDAMILLTWAKELGCNLVRLAHYPHNEHMVKLAEKMGIMVWDEIPVYQHIAFADSTVPNKMNLMMKEMIRRDRNRCGVVIWSLSNETNNRAPNRDNALINLSKECRIEDSTRLITSVFVNQQYDHNAINVWDTVYKYFDVMSVNEYLGWYVPWQGKPNDLKWNQVYQMPVIISEFGGEAKYGNHDGPRDEANSWNETYQEQIYKDQTTMFANIPTLAGICPWLLVDYRSLGRMHPLYQKGFNRKGLLSEYGEKKKAWYVLKSYYDSIKNNN